MVNHPRPVRRVLRVLNHLRRFACAVRELFERHRAAPYAIGEPGRIGDLVNAVGVRSFMRSLDGPYLREWTEDQVVHPIPDEWGYILFWRAADVVRVFGGGFAPARQGDRS